MSRRDYPRIGMNRQRASAKLCNCCSTKARWQVEFQVSWFRGEDECFLLCDTHHALVADMNLAELTRLKDEENARRRSTAKASS